MTDDEIRAALRERFKTRKISRKKLLEALEAREDQREEQPAHDSR